MRLSNKSSARLASVQNIYALEIDQDFEHKKLQKDLISYYKTQDDGEDIVLPHRELFEKLTNLVIEEKNTLDDIIIKYLTKDWRIDKLNLVLKSILRCAIAELIYMKDVPTKVVINEYTNIASSFFDSKETGFVNSTLDKISLEFRG
jgi:N utilization substance protein B